MPADTSHFATAIFFAFYLNVVVFKFLWISQVCLQNRWSPEQYHWNRSWTDLDAVVQDNHLEEPEIPLEDQQRLTVIPFQQLDFQ